MAKKLQVFVSSTFTDLKEERQAAVAAILKAGHIPAGMELFTSGNQSQLETIKKWIDESDVYMLILGGRYGSLEPISKTAYTHLEFDYAVAKGKPIFSVVISKDALDKKVQILGMDAVETINGAALKSFREQVLSYTSSFFEDEKDIRLTVYESLADYSANKDLRGWVPGNAVVDTQPLFDEIKKLSDENQTLRAEVQELRKRAKPTNSQIPEYDDLVKILNAAKIEIPKDAAGKSAERTLLEVFLTAQKAFSTGFTNKIPMSDLYKFLYFDVAPKLQIHGLVNFEKISGAEYRRCSLTAKGAAFLSECERRIAVADEKEESAKTFKAKIAEHVVGISGESSVAKKPTTELDGVAKASTTQLEPVAKPRKTVTRKPKTKASTDT